MRREMRGRIATSPDALDPPEPPTYSDLDLEVEWEASVVSPDKVYFRRQSPPPIVVTVRGPVPIDGPVWLVFDPSGQGEPRRVAGEWAGGSGHERTFTCRPMGLPPSIYRLWVDVVGVRVGRSGRSVGIAEVR